MKFLVILGAMWFACASAQAQMQPPPPAPGLTFHEVTSADGVPINVVEAGNASGPVLLFLHGAYQSYLSFIPQLRDPKLVAQFRMVAMDTRGHGGSGKPWDPKAYEGSKPYANDIQAVITGLKLSKPLLVGWSYGGFVAMDYVREYGAKAVRGLVFAGSHGGLLPRPAASGPLPIGDLEGTQASARQFMAVMSAQPPAQDVFDRGYAGYLMMPPYARKAMRGKRLDNRDLVASGVGVPLLFVVGTKDASVPLEDIARLAQTLPRAKLERYEGIGHSAFVEATERFNADVAKFSAANPL